MATHLDLHRLLTIWTPGPSYKRGPPKGYIHAIEQRWHQVESLLGAIVQCPDPRVQGLISDLKQDDLAREIIRRVDNGPYGPSGRRSQSHGETKEDFFASILKDSEGSISSRDSARARRQSRVSREIVSSNMGNDLSVIPTKEWQDGLSQHLASSTSSHDNPRISRRRKLENPLPHSYPEWRGMYTMDTTEEEEELKTTTEAIGELSLDENREVRFHGRTSGLHLIGKNNRTDDRVEGGIWRLPMSRVWPASKYHRSYPEYVKISPLPEIHVQDRLLGLYFTYVHPMFPVLHKSRFLAQYNLRKQNSNSQSMSPQQSPSPRPESSQEVTPLLLFSIFAITARFCHDQMPLHIRGKMWEAGCNFLDSARAILTQVFHESRPSTVQSLLLLGYREFGIGSQEQAWLFIGMAVRMATDLGLNCDSSNWKSHGQKLFSPAEIETRVQIWWACCVADSYGSVYLGRPIMIKEGDFDVPLPIVDDDIDQDSWPPIAANNLDMAYRPVPGHMSTCWRAVASLCMITGSIVDKIYSIRHVPHAVRRASYSDIESRLDQWYIGLPESLRFEPTSRRTAPPPHILFLHIRYWGAVLLLNRAFIPNWKGTESTSHNTAEFKAFDLAQSAATHLSAIATIYRETFSLKQGSSFLTSYILNAAVMHILTLTLRPLNVQASLGFKQCMEALKDMQVVWPSASRAWELLNGVQLGSNDPLLQITFLDRPKRPADAAFGLEKNSDYLQRETFPVYESNAREENTGVQELGTRIMAHMLGLRIPGIESSTSYYPGYEWWPRTQEAAPPESHSVPEIRVANGWNSVPVSDPVYTYGYDGDSYGL
ncbi:hypothetical protein H2248_001229 [Termitomyces sp. 'cryptogamus']|nr:hypothetical protein H2248_001229 [Termitomyces sp. 'cryptogamus']